jgi:hypothetical protein
MIIVLSQAKSPFSHETALANGRRGTTPRGERIHVRGSL